jgi:hypothetical protein
MEQKIERGGAQGPCSEDKKGGIGPALQRIQERIHIG